MANGQDEIGEVSATNNSIETFTSALVFNLVVGVAIFLVFCVLRPLNHVVYAPRASLAQADKHPPEIGNGFISWVWPTLRIPDAQVLERTTLDSFMLLRFFKSCLKLFGLFALLGIGILLPINVHGGGNETGLQALAISNVSEGSNLLWAHLVITVVFLGAIVYTLLRDIQLYIRLRHNYLTNPTHQASAQSHALLVTDIPRHLQSKDHLARLFSVFPGGVRQVYLPRGVPKLEELVTERDDTAIASEKALTKYVVSAAKLSKKDSPATKPLPRPTHRTGFLGLWGTKVDSITTYAEQLLKLNTQIEDEQSNVRKCPRVGSAFVLFHNQAAAHMAYQALLSDIPMYMCARHLEIDPSDVIWENLAMSPYFRNVRKALSIAITIALVVFWGIPSALVSSIASLDTLGKYPVFKEIYKLPEIIIGVIQGILPAIALAVLMMLLPMVLRFLCRFEGMIKRTDVELSVMHRYFFFQVVNVFLIVTLTKGALAAVRDILDNPQSIAYSLAKTIPGANVFFITYIMLQALSGATKELLMVVPLILKRIKAQFLASSPRDLVNVYRLEALKWGTTTPKHTLIFVIGLCYSTIAPVILIFVEVYFALFYLVYRYQMLHVFDLETFDAGGLTFPRVVSHVFTGMYLFELTFLGLMALHKSPARIIIMVVVLALTVVINVYVYKVYGRMFEVLPVTLYDQAAGAEDGAGASVTEPLLASHTLQGSSGSAAVAGQPLTSRRDSLTQGSDLLKSSKGMEGGGRSDHASLVDGASTKPLTTAELARTSNSSLGTVDPRPSDSAAHPAGSRSSHTWLRRLLVGNYAPELAQARPGSASMIRLQLNDPLIGVAYLHPALTTPTTTAVWVPRDDTALAAPAFQEFTTTAEKRAVVVTDHAFLNDKGRVQVDTMDPPTYRDVMQASV